MEVFYYGACEIQQSRGVSRRQSKKFPVYEIYLDGVIVTKVSSKTEAEEMVSRWQEVYK